MSMLEESKSALPLPESLNEAEALPKAKAVQYRGPAWDRNRLCSDPSAPGSAIGWGQRGGGGCRGRGLRVRKWHQGKVDRMLSALQLFVVDSLLKDDLSSAPVFLAHCYYVFCVMRFG